MRDYQTAKLLLHACKMIPARHWGLPWQHGGCLLRSALSSAQRHPMWVMTAMCALLGIALCREPRSPMKAQRNTSEVFYEPADVLPSHGSIPRCWLVAWHVQSPCMQPRRSFKEG